MNMAVLYGACMAHTARTWMLASVMAASVGTGQAQVATFDYVRATYQPSETLVLDRHGAVLQRLRTDLTVRRGQWVALADVSPALRTALVMSEDQRFYEHSGVDWQAVGAAAWANLWNTRTRGASTITMQLAGLLDANLRAGAGGRGLGQKIDQALAAQTLERHWRKDQILEAYLNLLPWRGELVGIDALSRTLFDKAASGLDHREAALAAALVRAPNAPVAQVVDRACGVWRLLQPAASDPGCLSMRMFTELAVQRRAYPASAGIAPHLAQRAVRAAKDGVAMDGSNVAQAGSIDGAKSRFAMPSVIATTLDADLQRFAVATVQRQLRELAGRHVEDAAVVVLDNRSGAVLAWVGSSGALGTAPEVDGVTALRQPGSTLKPFLYAQALAERRITAASLLEDAATHIPTAGGLYIPQNYDLRFKGWVSARTALAASLNVPAVRTLAMVSPQAFHAQLRQLGLPLRESGDYYGFSLALGSAEVTLLDLANAYRALANQGRASATIGTLPVTIAAPAAPAGPVEPAAVAAPRQVLDPRAAFIVGDMLSDSNARARTFGTDSVLATRFWSAVKTGTSKDMRDNWALGWSQHYTVGVWVGNASGAPMRDVSGISGAAPIWAAVMQHLHRNRSSRAPVPPPGVVRLPVRFGEGDAAPVEARRQEWFIQGTQQAVFAVHAAPDGGTLAQAARAARILLPTDGTIIALDPDIPPAHQRLRLQTHAVGMRWLIDGRLVGTGPSASWLPWPGRHTVTLVDAQDQVRDSARIEVRGASVKLSHAAADGLR